MGLREKLQSSRFFISVELVYAAIIRLLRDSMKRELARNVKGHWATALAMQNKNRTLSRLCLYAPLFNLL